MNQQHKFSVGQQVRYSSVDPDRLRASGIYEIAGLLPVEGLYLRYRIRSSMEKFDRVASEWQLDEIGARP
jgi:hypothetical protein